MSQDAVKGSSAPHKRRLRNFLLDKRFQLKYAGYLMLIAVVMSTAMGVVLLRTSDAVVAQSRQAVRQGEVAVGHGQQVLEESKKVSAVVQMNIVNDPAYAKDPVLREAFANEASARDEHLRDQQAALRAQAAALKHQAAQLGARQRTMFLVLVVALVLLSVAIGLGGIVVTHRVAGPVFKMKRQLRELAAGNLQPPDSLRRGDELTDFFEAFNDAVNKLRARHEGYVAQLDAALESLEPTEPAYGRLRALRDELAAATREPS